MDLKVKAQKRENKAKTSKKELIQTLYRNCMDAGLDH